MMRRVVFGTMIASLFSLSLVQSQKVINLNNPSFEGYPHQGGLGVQQNLNEIMGNVTAFQPIPKWIDCGFKQETPPDLHGDSTNFFGVNRSPQHGNSFLGMVVRYNDTWERISQKLTSPLRAGQCYQLSIYLARDTSYKSPTRENQRVEKSFTQPCVLRIHGGNGYCAAQEVLAESEPIKNDRWRRYDFTMKPKQDWEYIELEAFYKTPVLFPYNGNVLLDNASVITEIPCPDQPIEPAAPQEIAAENKLVPDDQPDGLIITPQPKDKVQKPVEPVKKEPEVASSSEKKEKVLKALDANTIKEGQVIQIEKLYFKADEATVTSESYDVLDEVYSFLSGNPDVTVEIGGHTNDRPPHHFCDSLSTARAISVADYLIERGIKEERIETKGYGKRRPIASNRTIAGRKRNQRVEIKILTVGDDTG